LALVCSQRLEKLPPVAYRLLMASGQRHHQPISMYSTTYQLFMLVLCVYALGVLAIGTVVDLDPGVKAVLEYADWAVCFEFFVDFLISLWVAEDKRKYLLTWGWLDLLSSIPTLSVARWGRLGRIMRLFRVLRGFRATRI